MIKEIKTPIVAVIITAIIGVMFMVNGVMAQDSNSVRDRAVLLAGRLVEMYLGLIPERTIDTEFELGGVFATEGLLAEQNIPYIRRNQGYNSNFSIRTSSTLEVTGTTTLTGATSFGIMRQLVNDATATEPVLFQQNFSDTSGLGTQSGYNIVVWELLAEDADGAATTTWQQRLDFTDTATATHATLLEWYGRLDSTAGDTYSATSTLALDGAGIFGRVGIGSSTPSAILSIGGNNDIQSGATSTLDFGIACFRFVTEMGDDIYYKPCGGVTGDIQCTGNTAWATSTTSCFIDGA